MSKPPSILIFGGTGSLGRALIKRYLEKSDREVDDVVAFSRDEAKHWTLMNEFASHPHAHRLKFIVGDIRDKKRVIDAIRQIKPNTIIIAAALKQVDTCELSPSESVLTNMIGTQNVVEAVIESLPSAVKTVLFVSTDKACSPVNVYGMCKALSERLVTSVAKQSLPVKFVGVRYGNVLESRGSIIPLFKYQGENNTHFTVTNPDMTRFVMTLDDSVDLIEKTIDRANSGEIWIPRLPSMKIGDLADIFSKKYNKPIKFVGLRPGEKMHEALLNDSEATRTRLKQDNGDNNYIISPAFVAGKSPMFQYTSADDVMTQEQLEAHLSKLGILDAPLSSFQGRVIEEIVKDVK